MIDNQDVEIEYSPLSSELTHDGIKVKVEIYRLRGAADGWSLEVVDHEGVIVRRNFVGQVSAPLDARLPKPHGARKTGRWLRIVSTEPAAAQTASAGC
jgi:hypothetical protein